ncbi:MAG: hypothetical protein ABI378_05570 [Chitinophagaceae bacterium]
MTTPQVFLNSLPDRFRNWLHETDVFLLLFLLVFSLDSVVAKPSALFLALVFLRKDIRKFRFKDAPWFYLLLPAMECIRLLFFNKDFSAGHLWSFSIGTAYWLMAYATFLIVRFRVQSHRLSAITGTLESWFFINLAVSLFQLFVVMYHSHSFNPYGLSDLAYGNSTGDFIKGVVRAPCYINMFINSFFAVWFLFRNSWRNALLAMLVCCLTTTNFANIIFLPILFVLLFVLKEKRARFTILGGFGIFVLFSILFSSGNVTYLKDSMDNVSVERMTISAADADTSNKSFKADSARKESARIAAIYEPIAKPNGKMLSWKETWAFASSSTVHALFGAGMGNFSSLLAIRTAHLYGHEHSRFYEYVPQYIHPDFRANHYKIMAALYSLPEGYHSARHMPHSFPNKILGEYGIVGVLIFIFGYVWYFLKRGAASGFFLFVMLLTGGYLWFDYLFEYLSVMVFFELFFWWHFFNRANERTQRTTS